MINGLLDSQVCSQGLNHNTTILEAFAQKQSQSDKIKGNSCSRSKNKDTNLPAPQKNNAQKKLLEITFGKSDIM